jgi:hypothetical protein
MSHRRVGDAGGHLDHTNAPTIMIAEKGAAMIKGAARQRLAA